MPLVVPVSETAVRVTVLPVPTFLSEYAAVWPVSATFAELLASPEGTFTRTSCAASVMVDAVVRSYTLVDDTTSAPPTVRGRRVMFALSVGWVST